MYVKRLELVGFKSFAEKTELEFGPGITAVVGPNGSGKSNIAEAIRWVLGEHSARELRGAQMADVVFAGSEHKKAMGYAQVSLILDNSDGQLPLPYTEVMITRRVDRAGEGEYFINQVPCRLKDVVELFLDTGIGKENYSVVGQGRIDEILAARPEERRAVFEEAAGVARYKLRKKEATRKLEETEQSLLRLADLIGELEARLADLQVQAEKAARYQELSGELGDLEVGLLAQQLQQAGADLANWQEAARGLRARLQEAERNLQDAEGALEVARQLAGALEQEAGALQARRVEAAARLERAEGQVNLLRQQEQQAAAEAQRLAGEVGGLEARLGALATEAAQVAEQAAAAKGALAAVQGELAAAEAAQRELQAALAAAADAANAAQEQAFRLAQQAAEKRNLALVEDKAKEQARERLARLEGEAAAAGAGAAAAQAALAAAAARLEGLGAQQAARAAAIAAARGEEQQAEREAQAATAAINGLRERMEAIGSRLSLLEDLKAAGEGFQKGTRTVLQGRESNRAWARGVLGAVAEAVRTEPRFERAIETALGAGLQYIITDTEQAARACVNELKRTGGGRATFLPLDIIRPNGFRPEELRELAAVPGFLGAAVDLCRFAGRFRPAVANLLGRVAIAADLDAALAIGRQTGFRHRVVTLDGEVLAAGGALTGGSAEGRSAGLLSREREREELAAELPRRREELAAARQRLEAARAAAAAAARTRAAAEQALRELELAATAAAGEVERHRLELVRCTGRQGDLQREAAAVADLISGGDALARQLLMEAEGLAQAQARAEAERVRWQEQAAGLQGQVEAAGARVTALRVRQAELAQEERTLAGQAARLAAEAAGLRGALADRAGARSVLEQRRRELERELAAALAAAQSAGAEEQGLRERQEALQARRLQAQEQANQHEREIRQWRRAQTEAAAQLSAAEVEAARLQAELDNLAGRLRDSYGLTPEQVRGRELGAAAVPLARQRILALRDLIRDLGPVNLAALEEYRQARERHQFLSQQRADLEAAKAALYRAIDELDRRMRQQFRAAFEAIRREFQQVYQELFEGGRADLVLLDDGDLLESGVDMVVAPPGKKPTPLQQLSGGERAMTACALLFALLRVKPSPFVVLDEVEAALDEANVERVGRYLQQHAGGTQFICITHQRGTMAVADALYGVTMEGTGVSRVVSVRFADVQDRRAG